MSSKKGKFQWIIFTCRQHKNEIKAGLIDDIQQVVPENKN